MENSDVTVVSDEQFQKGWMKKNFAQFLEVSELFPTKIHTF